MKFVIFFILLILAGALLVLRNILRVRARLKLLSEAGRVSSFDSIQQQQGKFKKMVQTNFGYGTEVWAFAAETDQVDLKVQAFKTATLVLPRPKSADLKKFCQSQGVALVLMMVKR